MNINTTKNNKSTFYVLFALIIACLIAIVWFNKSFKDKMSEIQLKHIAEDTEKYATILDNKLNEEHSKLQILALSYQENVPEFLKRLSLFEEANDLTDILAVNMQGNHLIDEEIEQTLTYYKPYLDGNRYISPVYYGASGISQITFEEPITIDKEDIGAILASYPAAHFLDLYPQEWEGIGFSCVTDQYGNFIFKPQNQAVHQKVDNLKKLLTEEEDIKSLEQALSEKKQSEISIFYQKEKLLAWIYPLKATSNWFIVFAMSENVISEQINRLSKFLIGIFAVVIIITLVISALSLFRAQQYSRELIRLATIDPVTGIYNYDGFKLYAKKIIEENPNTHWALMYNDIKHFKLINDRYGFETGDKILRHVATQLKQMRNLVICGRLSKDNFLSLISFQNENELYEDYKTIRTAACNIQSITNDNNMLIIYAGAYYMDDSHEKISVQQMIDRAIVAQKEAIKQSQLNLLIYSEGLLAKQKEEFDLEQRMYTALENNEFLMYLQPKVRIEDKKVVGAEALSRWNHPEKGLIMPATYIPLFERTGFIRKLDTYMVEKACALLRKWLDAGKDAIDLSVNVSRALIADDEFLYAYTKLKRQYNLPDNCLELEFTESMALDDTNRIREVTEYLRSNGFICSIDDFGSGYSSLNLLKDLSIDVLKIDRIFFENGLTAFKERTIVRNIVTMAHELSITTVAEGVENTETVEFLNSIHCNSIQGFIFAKPMPIEKFEETYLN